MGREDGYQLIVVPHLSNASPDGLLNHVLAASLHDNAPEAQLESRHVRKGVKECVLGMHVLDKYHRRVHKHIQTKLPTHL